MDANRVNYYNRFKRSSLDVYQSLLGDLISARNHQSDFDRTRAEYISKRLSTMLIVVSPLLILWLGVDFLLVTPPEFIALTSIRVVTALALLFTCHQIYQSRCLRDCKRGLYLTLFILNTFYFCSEAVLVNSTSQNAYFGYSLLPFMFISMLTIFPLTAIESLFMGLMTIIMVAFLNWQKGALLTFDALCDLWLLSLLLVIALWAQMTQLHILIILYQQATRDPLTGLLNRRKLMEKITLSIQESEARRQPAVMLLFDLDHFKNINDTFGHQAGDQVLQCFAGVLEDNMRTSDSIGRYGGEEFVCMLPCTEIGIAMVIAERIRIASENQKIQTTDNRVIRFTTSVGVARYQPSENPSTFIDRADDSLYNAKHEGRNRVVLTEV